jgi:hypothetical protein
VTFQQWVYSTFRQVVEIELPAGEDAYGREISGLSYATFARIEPGLRLLTTAQGTDVVVTARAWLEAEAPVEAGARLTWNGTVYTALSGGPLPDVAGNITHQEWNLGSA